MIPRQDHLRKVEGLLERLDVIHAGQHSFPLLGDRMRAVAFERIFQDLEPLPGHS